MIDEKQLQKLLTDVEVIRTKLEGFMQYVNEDMINQSDDHEERIRNLEQFKSKAMGAIVASGIFGSVLATLFQMFFNR